MARITKASLEEFAKEIAALEAADATILSPEEMERYSGGRYGAYTTLGTSQSDHEAHALAGLEHDLLSTEVGMTREKHDASSSFYQQESYAEREPNVAVFSFLEPPSSGAMDDCSGGSCDPSGGYGYNSGRRRTDVGNAIMHPQLAFQFKENAERAEELTKDLEGQHNGYADALRHCMWSALNQKSAGKDSKVAKEFGNGHENFDGNPEREKKMDLHNNEVGYELGKKAIKYGWSEKRLFEEAKKAAQNGRLLWY